MRSILVLALSLASTLLLPAESLETRHIHLIKIMDSMSDNAVIADGVRSIEYGIEQEIELMRTHLGITDILVHEVSGIDFRRDQLDQVLDHDIQYQERDIIVLVYVGHGYRDPGTSTSYPKLYLDGYEGAIDFADLREKLLGMNPSVLINMVVACNVTQHDQSVPPDYQAGGNSPPIASLTPRSQRQAYAYMQLFADQPGYTKVVDLMSARPEKFTYMTRSGGVFFSEVLFTFYEIFADQSLHNWEQVCQLIEQRTRDRSREQGLNQEPFCRYSIEIQLDQRIVVQPDYPKQPVIACNDLLRQRRRSQRRELKDLRRKHRREIRELRRSGSDRSTRRLMVVRQRRERAEMMETHEQNYQRDRLACR